MAYKRFSYGYEMKDGKIIINNAEAEIVRNIFRKRSEGVSIYALAKEMMETDPEYFTGNGKKASCKISAILYNQKYVGEKGYETIVDSSVFEKVQEMKGKKYVDGNAVSKHGELSRQHPVSSSYNPSASVLEKEDALRKSYEGGDADSILTSIYELAAAKYDCVDITMETEIGG